MRSRLTYANVMSSIAVFLAVAGGTAVAAATITGEDIVDRTITAADIAPQSLGAGQVTDGSLSGQDIIEGGIYSSDVADGSLDGSDLATGAVGGRELGNGSVGSAEITDGNIFSADVHDDALSGADIYEPSLARVPAAAKAPVEGLTLRSAVSGSESVQNQHPGPGGHTVYVYLKGAKAVCPSGTKLIAGGAAVESTDAGGMRHHWGSIVRSSPDPAAPTTTWRATGSNPYPDFWQVRAWVVCANAA